MIWKSAIMGRTTTLTPKACDNYRLDRSTSPDCQLHELADGGKGGAACTALGLMNSAREAGFYTEVFSCRSVYRERSFAVVVYDRRGGVMLVFFCCDATGSIETDFCRYPEILIPEPYSWGGYFERMLDWYTSPSTTL